MVKKRGEESEEAPSFEQSLGDLEQIVAKLEGGKLPLAEALSAYELGVKRLSGCHRQLREAERRIELVQSVDAQGKAQTTPLDDAQDEDLTDKSAARSRKRTAAKTPRRVDDEFELF